MADVSAALGYGGGALAWSSSDEYATLCGNSIRISSLEKETQRVIIGAGKGIACFAVNAHQGLVAYAEKTLSPKVHIHKLDGEFSEVAVLEGVAELEVTAMAFSANGEELVTVASEPDLRLQVWEWHKGSLLAQSTVGRKVANASFHPYSSTRLCTSGDGEMLLWTTEEQNGTMQLVKLEVALHSLAPHAHVWSPMGDSIYTGCLAGELLLLNAASGEPILSRPTPDQELSAVMATLSASHPSAILSLAVNREAVVAAGECSAVCWWLHPTELGGPLGERNDVECGVRGIPALGMGGPHFNQVLAGSSDASVHLMEIPPAGGGEAEAEVVAEYHLGRVTAAAALSDGEHFVTSGEDGTLRVWSIENHRLHSKRQFGTIHRALATNEHTRCLAMGSEKGILRVINTSDLDNLPATFCSKLHTEAIQAVNFSPNASMLLSYSADHRMFFCTVVGSVVRVLGFLKVPGPGPLLKVSWAGKSDEDSMVVASMGTGELLGVSPPHPGTIVPRTLEIGQRDYTTRRVKIDTVAVELVALAGGDAPVAICYGADRKLRRFQLKKEAPFWGGLAGRTVQPDARMSLPSKPLGAISAARGNGFLALAGQDGTVQVLSAELDDASAIVSASLHDSFVGGASVVAFSLTGSILLSGGLDGSVFISKGLPAEMTMPAPVLPKVGASFDLDTPDDLQQLDEIKLRAKKEADRLHKETEGDRQAVRQVLGSLRKIFTECLERNQKAPELERLGRQDFIVDQEMHAKLLAEGMEKVGHVRKGIENDTLKMKLLRERVLACTQKMHVRGATLVGVKNTNLEVSSYPLLPSNSGPDVWKLKKAMMLRRVEMKAQRHYFHINGDLAYRLELDADGQPTPDRRLAQLEAQDEELLTDAATGAATDSKDVNDLMYSPLDLYCSTRKVIQALIIQNQIRTAKEAFNKEFLAMVDRKHKDTDRLADYNARIEERTRELLKISPDGEALIEELGGGFHPVMDDEREREDLRFVVRDDEVSVGRFISEEEAARLAAEKAATEAQMAKNAADNSTARALTMMMGGTLERPDDGMAEFAVERPVWLDTDPKAWGAEQLKEYKEYEAKQKAATEEMAKKIQTVETELRTLKAGVEDTCAKFDEALAALSASKHATDSMIYQMEFRVMRLNSAIEAQHDYSDTSENGQMQEMETLRVQKDKNTALLSEMRRKVESQRERVEAISAEDKAMEKSFKKDFAEAEEHVNQLYQLFRKRVVQHAATGQAKFGESMQRGKADALVSMDSDSEDVDSLDPFPNAGNLHPDEEPTLDRSVDCPAGLDTYWWDQLVKARDSKLQVEADLRKEGAKLEAMQQFLQKLSANDDQLKAEIRSNADAMTDFLVEKRFHALNLDIPVTLKQGQVEAETPSDTVSDMSDAVLLHRNRVENINEVIKHKGGKKVEVLTAIKDFKKGSYELEWNSKKLDREAEDLVEKTKELQLLRVTKSLQEVLKRGAEAQSSPHEQSNLEALLKYNAVIHNKNLMDKQNKLIKLQTSCREKQLQNYECLHQIQLMETKLGEQGRIAKSHEAAQDLSPSKRMKTMVTHKRLTDISKAQREELEMLRAEVERLNLRTYPSFVEESPCFPDTDQDMA